MPISYDLMPVSSERSATAGSFFACPSPSALAAAAGWPLRAPLTGAPFAAAAGAGPDGIICACAADMPIATVAAAAMAIMRPAIPGPIIACVWRNIVRSLEKTARPQVAGLQLPGLPTLESQAERMTNATSWQIGGGISLPTGDLFHSHRLCQIAWLIDVRAHEYGRMVGDELDRHGVEQRVGEGVRLGHPDVGGEAATGLR